jgi:tetratricopeptide (TPR) repeat protein
VVKNITYLVIGLLIGLAGGFLAANWFVHMPLSQPSTGGVAETDRGDKSPSNNRENPLSNEEIRQAIARADQEPRNLKLQKELGTVLLRYATFTGDASYLDDVARLLKRVQESSPQDSEVLTSLGDVELIKAQTGDKKRLKSAESYYRKSLSVKGEDSSVRSNLGVVYLNMDPPAFAQARGEFEKALKTDPTNERALQGAAVASIRSGDASGARLFIEVLKRSHPDSDSIRQLETELETTGSGSINNRK